MKPSQLRHFAVNDNLSILQIPEYYARIAQDTGQFASNAHAQLPLQVRARTPHFAT
ncbi:MAG: hypothetical protein WKF84_21935 [Pyrinomonadaceae bacterium]